MRSNNFIDYYLDLLGDIPDYLLKYINNKEMMRLEHVDYFCGMKYASKEYYDFKYSISRLDHSLSCALMVYKLTKDKKKTLSALFHDIATPCFSHVIDYMNGDYSVQESTEEFTEDIIRRIKNIDNMLRSDGLNVHDIANPKMYSIVDNDRPKLCADRLDGIILTSVSWTNKLNVDDVEKIIDSALVVINEEGNEEIGFDNEYIAKLIKSLEISINEETHKQYDNYFMQILASLVKRLIDNSIIKYNDLYLFNDYDMIRIIKKSNIEEVKCLYDSFVNPKDISYDNEMNIKQRVLKPLYYNTHTGLKRF